MEVSKIKHKREYNVEVLERECFDWASTIIKAIVVFTIVFTVFIRIVVVSGTSMLPTLRDGDWMILNSFLYSANRGDIVVIKKDDGKVSEHIIKRIIAVEGDNIQILGGDVYLNGSALDETSYIGGTETELGDAITPEIIPEGYVFAMGDKRDISFDSRYKGIGLINEKEIVGRASAIIFPFSRIRFT